MSLAPERQLQERAEEMLERHATPRRLKDRVTLRRGEARPFDLSEALDALGVETGEDFVVMRAVKGGDPAQDELGPFQRHSETSRQAALANAPRSGTQRALVLRTLQLAGDRGCTRQQLERITKLPGDSIRPRVVELLDGGFVEARPDTRGETVHGNEAELLIVTPKGREAEAQR